VPVGEQGGYFDLELEPGETRQLSVQLSNRGETPVTARTYPADAYTIVNGGFAARLAGEPTSGTTHWIDYQDETLELAAGETVIRSLSVRVPEDATAGQYLTALVIQNAEPIGGDSGAGVGLDQVIRQTIAVAIRVPGPDVPALRIGAAEHALVGGRSVVSFEVENNGNVHLVPGGTFILTDAAGNEVASLPLQMATVYAGTGTLLEAPLPFLLEPGEYEASLELSDDEYAVQAASGLLPLSIPLLDVPRQAPTVEPVTGTQQEEDVRQGGITISIPTWAVLVAIPAAMLFGVLLTLGVVLALRLRDTANAPVTPARNVTHETTAPPRRPATIRPLIPPSRTHRPD
jgi:hypothetical protein